MATFTFGLTPGAGKTFSEADRGRLAELVGQLGVPVQVGTGGAARQYVGRVLDVRVVDDGRRAEVDVEIPGVDWVTDDQVVADAAELRAAGLAELTSIARERFETGAHGGVYLALAPDAREHLFTRYPATTYAGQPPAGATGPTGAVLGMLTGIPVRVDGRLPPGRWELRDWVTDEVKRSGVIA